VNYRASGLRREADDGKVFRALQSAYINLLRNPFYDPDEHSPARSGQERKIGSTQITSLGFIKEVQRIGEAWTPGAANI
jgi:hypothetical protein